VNTADSPLVSVVVVNWNGEGILDRCLQALKEQTFQDYEVILVDNASTDKSIASAEEFWPEILIIKLDRNLGFAEANNIGARQARGQWLALLNNDAFPAPDWLEQLVAAGRRYPESAFFASKLINASNESNIESTGDIFHVSGNAWHRDYNQPKEKAIREEGEVFSACAAAALYNRQAFEKVGGFDEDYYSHVEDIDLGFRLQLQGYHCMYVPSARVLHIGSASFGKESDITVYQVQRNMVWTYFKNMPTRQFWKYLPAHLLSNAVFLLFYSFKGQWRAIWRAKFDAVKYLPKIWRKRKQIQSEKIAADSEIEQMMDHSWFGPYLIGKRSRKLRKIGRSSSIN